MEIAGINLLRKSKKVIIQCTADLFWAIIDLLEKEESEYRFYENRQTLLNSYKEGKFFVLSYVESSELYETRDLLVPHTLEYSSALCSFCTLDKNNEIEIIWTHNDYRNMGFATTFIDFFYNDIGSGDEASLIYKGNRNRHVSTVISESKTFWEKKGFQYDYTA